MSRRALFRFAFVYMLLSFASANLWAGEFPPISKEEMEFKEVPGEPGAPAVVLYRESFDDDAAHMVKMYVRIKVLTEAGRKFADVEIPYPKGRYSQLVEEIRGRTTHSDGTVIKWEGKALDKLIVKSRHLSYSAKVFTLPDVQPGSIIEYSYVQRRDPAYALPPHWTLQGELFQRKIRYTFLPISGRRMGLRRLAWVMLLPKGAALKPFQDGYQLEMNNVPAFEQDEMMPPGDSVRYHVYFYYRTSGNPNDYWKEMASYWNKGTEAFLNKTGGIEAAVAKLISASDSPEQKVRKIYTFVQTLENRSFLPRRSELEEKALHVESSLGVEDVLSKKSGYRSELTLLFIAMVRSAQVPAYAMVVSDRADRLFDPAYQDFFAQMDDEIAVVTLNGTEVFLDPGTKHCPYGLLAWQHTASKGFRQFPDRAPELAQTPVPVYTDALTKKSARFTLTDEGELKGSVVLMFFGYEALNRRLAALSTDDVGREKLLVDEVKSQLPAGADVALVKQPAWDDYLKPLVVEFKVTTPALMNAGAKRALLPLNILEFGRKPIFSHSQRTQPLMFTYPSHTVDEVRISLPSSFDVEAMPSSSSFKLSYAGFGTTFERSGNEIVTKRDVVSAIVSAGANDYNEVKGFFDKVKEADDRQLVLRKSTSGL